MRKQVEWSELAKSDLEFILDYLFLEWNVTVANKFIDKVDGLIHHIIRNPKQFPLINHNLGIRKCVITKQNSLFYRIVEDRIEIIRLFDTRQDPGKLNLKR